MGSRILERSGKAVVEYCELIGWRPSVIYMVGVGPQHQEIVPMQATWPTLLYVGYEAHPAVCKQIQGHFPGIVHPYAISDFVGEASLFVPNRWKNGCSLFRHNPETQVEEITVDVTTLDMVNSVTEYPDGGLLWLDCEGSELNALNGGQTFITDKIDAINIEMTGVPRGPNWCKPIDVYRKLTELGFLQVWTHTHRTCIGQYDAIYLRKKLFKPEFCNCLGSVAQYEEA